MKTKSYLNDKSILVYDYGLCLEIARKLAEKFGKVFYYVPWQDAFPTLNKSLIGLGFEDEGIFKVNSFWDYVDDVDLIATFDTYSQDIFEYLKSKGYKVFAPGFGEWIENDRLFGRQIQAQVGLPVQQSTKITGVENLREYLKNNPDVYVKLNSFRGLIETFYSKDYESSEVFLDYISEKLGQAKDRIDFLVEKKIDGLEPGYDGFVVDGQYPNYGLFAYEKKGSGYIASVQKYQDIPEPIKIINDKLAKFFKDNKIRSFFSTEVIVTKEREGYLIDPTVRSPMPVPTAVQLEIYDNIPEFIYEAGVNGKLIDLEPKYRYGGGVALDSDWANDNWMEIIIKDKDILPYVKFRRVIKKDNRFFAVPGFSSVCSVIGLGDSVDEVINQVNERLDYISGFELQKNTTGLMSIKEDIEKGEKEYNLSFRSTL